MNEDEENNAVSIAPKPGHYDSLKLLRSELIKFSQNEIIPIIDNLNKLNPSYGKFEKINCQDGTFLLIPVEDSYVRLYRGENAIFPKCKPSIFRQNITHEQLFVEKLLFYEFESIVKNHPIVKQIFLKNNFRIDYFGLAQHYGLKTNILDLTSDIDIALFFATCDYEANENSGVYSSFDQVGTKKGAIYLIYTPIASRSSIKIWGGRINPIGLQPFKRPGNQKGFSFHLKEGEELNDFAGVYKYTFDYTKEDSFYFYKKFQTGKKLWDNDPILQIIAKIKKEKNISYLSFLKCIKEFNIPKQKINSYKKILHENDFNFRKNKCNYYSKKQLQKIIRNFNENEFWNSIVKRRMVVGKKQYPCVTLDFINYSVMMNMFHGVYARRS